MPQLKERDLQVLASIIGALTCLGGLWVASKSLPLAALTAVLGVVAGTVAWKIPPEARWGRYLGLGLLLVMLPALGQGRPGLAYCLEYAGAYIILSRGGYHTRKDSGS